MASLGERLKKLRSEHNLTQDEFIIAINNNYGYKFAKPTISHYENDNRTPELKALKAFAKYYKVSLDYLLGETDIKTPRVEPIYQAFHSLSTEELTEEEVELLENMIHQFKKNRGIID